jgi:transposase
MRYIGLDIHKKTISYRVKRMDGTIAGEGAMSARRLELDRWMEPLPQPWPAAMEATIFTSWVYEHLRTGANEVKVAHSAMLKAIAASKKKNDRIDARKIADLLPECYVASLAVRELRRRLR